VAHAVSGTLLLLSIRIILDSDVQQDTALLAKDSAPGQLEHDSLLVKPANTALKFDAPKTLR